MAREEPERHSEVRLQGQRRYNIKQTIEQSCGGQLDKGMRGDSKMRLEERRADGRARPRHTSPVVIVVVVVVGDDDFEGVAALTGRPGGDDDRYSRVANVV
uniref:Uncharacterized protein n=1 Tax=Plectus sambesii TaxID=2011161 RepID=A0A914WKI1_9BILA